jgi:hypothetical protein
MAIEVYKILHQESPMSILEKIILAASIAAARVAIP